MGWIGEYPGRVKANVKAVRQLTAVTILRYDSSVIADSTAKLPRGEAHYRDEVERIKATWRGPIACFSS